MAAVKSRYQNPTIGDTVALQMFVFNSNNYAEVTSINSISIYYLDPAALACNNPTGRVLIQTFPGAAATNPQTGTYELDLYLDPGIYTQTGRYIDVWNVTFQTGSAPSNVEQLFYVYPDLWYTTPTPVVYDFSFYFQPNRIRYGSKKWIEIQILPNVPTATDLQNYYENLAIVSEVFVNMSTACGPCATNACDEEDLLIDRAPAQYREKNRAFYFMDTTLYDCGIYNFWFELNFGSGVYISDTNQIQIYS